VQVLLRDDHLHGDTKALKSDSRPFLEKSTLGSTAATSQQIPYIMYIFSCSVCQTKFPRSYFLGF
jgi:hypothetical protein